jgi:hypothetical protein
MENDKMFNRLSGFFDQELEKVDHLTEKLGEDATAIAHEARERLKHGTDSLHAAEETALRAIREYRTTFLIAGASVLGLVIVASFLFGKISRLDK